MATRQPVPGDSSEIVKIAAHLAHLPALSAVVQRIDAWPRMLQEPLLHLKSSYPFPGGLHHHCVRRHLSTSVLMSIH